MSGLWLGVSKRDRNDLIEWLHTEEDEMQDVGFEREMYEASYIRKHVMEMPKEDAECDAKMDEHMERSGR